MKRLLFIIFLTLPLFAQYKYTNALIKEESPYLLQHAHNPINWQPWSQKTLDLAQQQNKLMFVSVGYSTCHWCHVMNKESFENEELAKIINENYIAIKVDKEEMPHIDTKYQEILKKVSKRRNGWPLNFILTPQKKLIFITTYIPPTFNYGVEGMNTLIPRIAKRYAQKDNQLIQQITQYESIINQKAKEQPLNKSLSDNFLMQMKKRSDKVYQGFDKQPKFPLATHLNLILDIAQLTKNKETFSLVYNSLDAMSNGGIFDHIEGGFYRYSVYADWIVPHFEKMLYTQAELIPLYFKAYQHTQNPRYKKIIFKMIAFTNETFKTKEHLYYSAIDADSLNKEKEKEEGFYYTYTYDEVKYALKKAKISNYDTICEYLGIDEFGNFEDKKNNIHLAYATKKAPKNLNKAVKVLKKLRTKRTPPFVDNKIITSWNALMIKALYQVSTLDKKYLKMAEKSLDSLIKRLYMNEQLYHKKLDYRFPIQKALFEDYVFVADLLITAYQKTFKKSYLSLALTLHNYTDKNYYKNKTWFLTKSTQYPASFNDKYYVSPLSRHFQNGLSLASLNSDLTLLSQTKKRLIEQKNNVLNNLDTHPEAIRALLRVEYGDKILKSNKKNLLKNSKKIATIKYPFLLTKEEATKLYLACDEISCFSSSKKLNLVIQSIDK